MKIRTYKKASEIEEKYLPSLVDAEIECWGSRPFDEYKICDNPGCKAIFSIEDVYETIYNYRNRVDEQLSLNFKCSCCNSKTELIYEKNNFLEIIREYIKGEVSRVLLIDDNEKVEGFGVLSKTTLFGAINYEFATRPNSYDKDILYKKLETNFNDINLLHQIYLSNEYRGYGYSKAILNHLINFCDKDKITLLETRFDSGFYPISRFLGGKNILTDKYGYVIHFFEKIFKNISQIGEQFSFYKNEAELLISQNKSFFARKFYN